MSSPGEYHLEYELAVQSKRLPDIRAERVCKYEIASGLQNDFFKGVPGWINIGPHRPIVYGLITNIHITPVQGDTVRVRFRVRQMMPPADQKAPAQKSYRVPRRISDITITERLEPTHRAEDQRMLHLLLQSVQTGEPVRLGERGCQVWAQVIDVVTNAIGFGIVEVKYTYRPSENPDNIRMLKEAGDRAAAELAAFGTYEYKYEFVHGSETIVPLTKEQIMRLYETVVLDTNEAGDIQGVAQDITLVVAKTAQAAKDQTLVDFAKAKDLTGKDLAGYTVRAREFQSAS